MIIRNLTEADYLAVRELYWQEECLHVSARPDCIPARSKEESLTEKAFLTMLQEPEILQMGAFDDHGTMIGMVRATLWNEDYSAAGRYVCLDNIYVLPEYRRQGIATKLYTAVKKWTQEQRAPRLELHVWAFNEEALALYRHWGFAPQRYVLEQKL